MSCWTKSDASEKGKESRQQCRLAAKIGGPTLGGPTWLAPVLLMAALAATAYAQLNMTAEQVFTFIKSSIQLHHDDRKVAEYVKKIKLSDKLEERRVEQLQGMGAGPRTVAALKELSTSSASLAVA